MALSHWAQCLTNEGNIMKTDGRSVIRSLAGEIVSVEGRQISINSRSLVMRADLLQWDHAFPLQHAVEVIGG